MMRQMHETRRKGSVLPLVAVCLVAMVGCVALAVDIGLFAEARTEMQDAVDAAVLAGTRQFNGVSANNNKDAAIAMAKKVVKANTVIGDPIKDADITDLQIGVYRYDTTVTPSKFNTVWTAPLAGENYGAMTMSLERNQYTVFARVFGINQQLIKVDNVSAVHRPRDIAIILDFSGSMSFGCLHNNGRATGYGSSSMQSGNMDPNFPRFGPWSIFPMDDPTAPSGQAALSPMQLMQPYSDGAYEYAPSNITYPTPNHGGPIVTDFRCLVSGNYDTLAWGWNVPASLAPPAVPNTAPAVGTYNPLDTTNPTVMPAPNEIANQSNANWTNAAGHEFGDKWPLMTTNPSSPPVPADYAKTVQDYVNFLYANSAQAPGITTGLASITNTTSMFNDPGTYKQPNAGLWWAKFGYSLNNNKVFYGYTMGPGYYGKTFYMWPPDPRQPSDNTVIAPPTAGQSTSAATGYIPGDWRIRFFKSPDNNNNAKFWEPGGQWLGTGSQIGSGAATGPQPDYTAVIKWIKGGPQVFPPNLRCGRCKYYDSIPNTIADTGGSNDEVFWRNYIDYVLGTGSYREQQYIYGRHRSTSWTNPATGTTLTYGANQIKDLSTLQNPDPASIAAPYVGMTQYMDYADMPRHPRAHFWFGPLTMVAFMEAYVGGAGNGGGSFMPGACHEAQCWELKAAVQSAMDDIKNNHPNDWTTLIFFSTNTGYNQPRSVLSNDYNGAKLYLWYPYRIGGLTPAQYLPDPTQEILAYNVSGSSLSSSNGNSIIPVAGGGTCYDMGLKVAFNQFTASSSASSQGGKGRIGARKLVIFETDGIINTNAGGTFNPAGPNQSYYSDDGSIVPTGGTSDGNTTNAVAVINNLRSTTNGWGNQCKVHCIGFGDLLEPTAPAARRTLAINSLSSMQAAGGTSNPIEPYKLITGTYTNRIDNLKNAFQRIMQGDIQLSLTQ